MIQHSACLQMLALCVAILHAGLPPAARSQGKQSDAPLFEGLGEFGRKVTTTSAMAQRYFDQGLCFLYAFNHDEAIRFFQAAIKHDPKCAMAWWGVAIANGPHINNPIVPAERAKTAWSSRN
jgi:hypothetical protein